MDKCGYHTALRECVSLKFLKAFLCNLFPNDLAKNVLMPFFHLQMPVNPLNADLNPIRHLLALLGAHHILHVSRIRVNKLLSKYLHSNGACYKRPSSHPPSTDRNSNTLDSSVFVAIKINFQGFCTLMISLYFYYCCFVECVLKK